MTLYEHILEVTRRQAEAARTGDIETAIALVEERGRLVALSPSPSAADEPLVREILQLDKDIATAIRFRMLALRDEMLGTEHGKRALAGYGSPQTRPPAIFDLPA